MGSERRHNGAALMPPVAQTFLSLADRLGVGPSQVGAGRLGGLQTVAQATHKAESIGCAMGEFTRRIYR